MILYLSKLKIYNDMNIRKILSVMFIYLTLSAVVYARDYDGNKGAGKDPSREKNVSQEKSTGGLVPKDLSSGSGNSVEDKVRNTQISPDLKQQGNTKGDGNAVALNDENKEDGKSVSNYMELTEDAEYLPEDNVEGQYDVSDKDGRTDVNATVHGEKNSAMEWIALFVALGALAIALYNYSKLNPKKNRRRNHQKPTTNEDDNQLSQVMEKVNDLDAKINILGRSIDGLQAQFNRMSNSTKPMAGNEAANVGNVNVSHPIVSAQEDSSNQKLYATTVIGDGFPVDSLSQTNSNHVIAILSIKGNKGTFIINDLSGAQTFLLSNFAYGVGRVCDIRNQSPNPTRVQTDNSGSIQLIGNSWKVTSKAQVYLI